MVSDYEMVLRLLSAVICSGLIGLEREFARHEAGLRTHIMVCLGSTLIMLTSVSIFDIYKTQANVDPSRIAAGVITGIGFLGAGTIIRSPEGVRGLTTASSLWVVASLGLAIGLGLYKTALVVTVLTLIVLLVLRKFEGLLKKGGKYGAERSQEGE